MTELLIQTNDTEVFMRKFLHGLRVLLGWNTSAGFGPYDASILRKAIFEVVRMFVSSENVNSLVAMCRLTTCLPSSQAQNFFDVLNSTNEGSAPRRAASRVEKKIIKTPHPHPGSIPWPRAWKSDALPTTPLGLDGDDRGQYAIVQDCNGTPCGCRRIDLDLANSVAFFFSLTTYGLVLAKARHFAHFITSNFHDLWNTLDISTPGIKTWWPQQSLFEIW